MATGLKLNLGCADRHLAGFLNVDCCQPADLIFDLDNERWPWDDCSVEAIWADDIVEHLASRIAFMNEAWRVLEPFGVLHIVTPNAAKGGGYFQDPDHCTPWTLSTFKYFDLRCFEYQRLAASYGIRSRFKVTTLAETSYQDPPITAGLALPDPVYKIEAVLMAVKP